MGDRSIATEAHVIELEDELARLTAEVERLRSELVTVQDAGVNLAGVASRLHEAVTVAVGWLDVKEPIIACKALRDALAREDGAS